MNLNEWIYQLSLRTALHRNDLLDPRPPRLRRREHAALTGARRAAIAGAALVAPALLVVSALLGQ